MRSKPCQHLRRTRRGPVIVNKGISRKHKRLNWHKIGSYKGVSILSPYKDESAFSERTKKKIFSE